MVCSSMPRSRICSLSVGMRSRRALLTSMRQQQVQLGVLLHRGLHEDHAALAGSRPAASQSSTMSQVSLLQLRGVLVAGGQHVPVGHHVEVRPARVLQAHPVLERARRSCRGAAGRWGACRRGCGQWRVGMGAPSRLKVRGGRLSNATRGVKGSELQVVLEARVILAPGRGSKQSGIASATTTAPSTSAPRAP